MKLAIIRDSLRATPRPWAVWLLEFFGNPALAGLFLLWLQLPESGVGQLLVTILVALVLVVLFLVIAGITLSWFVDYHAGNAPTFKGALGHGLRHFVWIGIWGLAAVAVWEVVHWAESYQYQFPNYFRSMLPAGMRGHLSEETVLWLFLAVLNVIFWVVLPALWLPPAAQLAARGFRGFGRDGFRAWGRSLKSLQYWLLIALGGVVGVWLPTLLLDRTPDPKATLGALMTSLILRMVVAYLLALSAWMMVASSVGRAAVLDGAVKRSAASA